jgi:hypothetical protein
MSMNQKVCALCYGSDLIIQDFSSEMVYCVHCNGFVPYLSLEAEHKANDVDIDADFLLAMKISNEMEFAPVEISHDLCTHHCPHCGVCIIVEELNCRIFRCGEGLNPHATEEVAAAYAKTKRGCGKQFRIDGNNAVHKCTGM